MVRILCAALVLLPCAAFANADCVERIELHANTQVSQQWFPKSRTCYVSVEPSGSLDLVYRSFTFSNRGLFMIFNSYGTGPSTTFTGAREFYLFPRVGMPKFTVSGDRIQITSSAGTRFGFDAQTSSAVTIDGGQITEDPNVNRENAGGVEIPSYPGLILDLGFRIGASPQADAKSHSVFRDGNNRTCDVQNTEVFDFSQDPFDPAFLFPSDSGLANFLQSRCPELDLTSLGES